jgi:hypothetical protein
MIYGSPARFESLFPSETSVNSALGLAHDLVQNAVRLDAQLPAGASRSALTALLRELSFIYSFSLFYVVDLKEKNREKSGLLIVFILATTSLVKKLINGGMVSFSKK